MPERARPRETTARGPICAMDRWRLAQMRPRAVESGHSLTASEADTPDFPTGKAEGKAKSDIFLACIRQIHLEHRAK